MSPEKFNVECPHCEYHFLLDVEFAGEGIRCFMCGKTFKAAIPSTREIRDDIGVSGGGAPEAEAGGSAGKAKTREQPEEAAAVRGEAEEPELKKGAQVKAKRRRRLLPLLIVTLVVVGALSGLVYALAGARERARRTRCHSNLNSGILYGVHLYASDFEESFPPTLGHLYPDYISDGSVFLCPSARKATPLEDDPQFSEGGHPPTIFGDTHSDYVYVSGLTASDPGHYVHAFDDEWSHDGEGINVCNIGFRGGRMSNIKAVHEQLARQEKELAAKGRKMKLLRPAWSSWPDPPAGWRPWYARPGTWVGATGALAVVAIALLLIVRTVRRGRKPGSDDTAQPER